MGFHIKDISVSNIPPGLYRFSNPSRKIRYNHAVVLINALIFLRAFFRFIKKSSTQCRCKSRMYKAKRTRTHAKTRRVQLTQKIVFIHSIFNRVRAGSIRSSERVTHCGFQAYAKPIATVALRLSLTQSWDLSS